MFRKFYVKYEAEINIGFVYLQIYSKLFDRKQLLTIFAVASALNIRVCYALLLFGFCLLCGAGCFRYVGTYINGLIWTLGAYYMNWPSASEGRCR